MSDSQRIRRFGAHARYPRGRAQAARMAQSRPLGARRVKKPGHSGLFHVSVSRDHRQLVRVHARTTRCVLCTLPEKYVAVPPAVHASMQGNKGRDTKPELIVRRRLLDAGLGGYRLQWKVPGRPDIAWPGKRVCIEVRGCFWHRCPHCSPPMPKSNLEYWEPKFARNVERDARNLAELEALGWRVHVIWECELKKNSIDATFERLIPELKRELGK